MDQHPSKIAVSAFGDPQKARLAAGRHLSRDETQPGGQVAASAEGFAPSNRRYERGRVQGADPRDRRQQLHRCILTGEFRKLGIEGVDPCIKGTPFVSHILNKGSDPVADRHFPIQELIQPQLKIAPSLCDYNSPFEKDCPKLVDERRSFSDKPIPGSMQALHVELLIALKINEPHCRTRRSFRNRLSIPFVVLLRLHIGTDILRRHQSHIVALLAKLAAKMMGTATRFHRHDAGRHSSRQLQHAVTAHPAPQ